MCLSIGLHLALFFIASAISPKQTALTVTTRKTNNHAAGLSLRIQESVVTVPIKNDLPAPLPSSKVQTPPIAVTKQIPNKSAGTFKRAIRAFLESNKVYPSSAKARRQEGVVLFELIKENNRYDFKILKEADHRRLNQSAQQLFKELITQLNQGLLENNSANIDQNSDLGTWEIVYQLGQH